MSDILIKNTAMPESCCVCKFRNIICKVAEDPQKQQRPDDCPLVEIPEPSKKKRRMRIG